MAETAGGTLTQRIDYLQRRDKPPERVEGDWTEALPTSRRLTWIRGIGTSEKDRAQRMPMARPERWRPTTTELITGMYGYRVGLAFQLRGSRAGVQVHLGTWYPKAADQRAQQRLSTLQAVLRGLYPTIHLSDSQEESLKWPKSGLVLGVPAPIGIDELDGATPIDRVVRSMGNSDWTVFVLAQPLLEEQIGTIRESVLNEIRAVSSRARTTGEPSPLTDYYVDLLKIALTSAGEAMATGGWRTAVYLLGDEESYPRLAAAWRSLMSGERSLPEPVRVFNRQFAASLARDWAMPDVIGSVGSGSLSRRPFELQTMLTTTQLATYFHLPQLETPGFTVTLAPRFDAVPKTIAHCERGIAVGRILHNGELTGTTYDVSLESLTRHVLVAGLTGSGKTNTVFSLLEKADEVGVPFLIIEPAKAEYRALLRHPRLGNRFRVFTAGRATVSPLVLNPFEVPAGTAVSEHLDLLRAVFAAAFGLWTPLPQILEQCLHGVYADRGWDPRSNANERLNGDDRPPEAFPTLGDLVAKVSDVLPTLGYDDKISGDFRAALTTRLGSLRYGGKGAMLDVSRSLPFDELLSHPTVIELESMGDEGDKAFVAGLLLIRLAEYRRANGQNKELVHLLVIEEAHRLLGNIPTHVSEEAANPRGQAVETFSNLLSEIRAYGQGVIIADQVPVSLAPAVMKNTNLKIAHAITSNDDREALAGAMAMNPRQTKFLVTLDRGHAAVFSSGDDSPVLVVVDEAKDPVEKKPPADAVVSDRMTRWRSKPSIDGLFLPRPFCAETCADSLQACDHARQLATDAYVQSTFARIVLATFEDIGALDRLWVDLVAAMRPRKPPRLDEGLLLLAFAGHGSDWFVRRRGAQEGWYYADAAQLRVQLQTVLIDKLRPGRGAATKKLRTALQETARHLHARSFDPFPACEATCRQDPPLCMYRRAAADLVASHRYQESFRDADEEDESAGDSRTETWRICEQAAHELVEWPPPDMPPVTVLSARRAAMCFGQQMLADDTRKLPSATHNILRLLLHESQL